MIPIYDGRDNYIDRNVIMNTIDGKCQFDYNDEEEIIDEIAPYQDLLDEVLTGVHEEDITDDFLARLTEEDYIF